MYLWQPVAGGFYPPRVDGDYDAGVIGHEYTHMIENRMIGKGSNRSGHHAGAMGESVSDLLAIERLNEHGNIPTDGANRWATGTFATGNSCAASATTPATSRGRARSRRRASIRRSNR